MKKHSTAASGIKLYLCFTANRGPEQVMVTETRLITRHFASLATEIVSHFHQFFLLSSKGTDYLLVQEILFTDLSPESLG